jgi:hypothetical protein
MAEMYKRTAEGYQYNETEDGITGQEIYIRDDVSGTLAVASLPVVGSSVHSDPYGSAVGSCYCRTKNAVFPDGHPDTLKWTMSFGTRKPSAESNPINNDPNNRRFRMGAEMVTIESPSIGSWVWGSGSGSGTPIDQKIYQRIVQGDFTIPKSKLTPAQNTAFIGSVISYAGRINSATFEGFPAGQVYFSGIEGGTTYDQGDLQYNYEMHFEFMINPHIGTSEPAYLYAYKESSPAGWAIPQDSAGNKLFGSVDLNSIK